MGGFALAQPPAVATRGPVGRSVPIDLPNPEALATLAAEVAVQREPGAGAFDLVVDLPPGAELDRWIEAGATWILTGFGGQPRETEVRATIEAGPGI